MTLRVYKSAESLVSCMIHVPGVTAVRKPEVMGSNPAIDHNFYVFLDTREPVLIYLQEKQRFVGQKYKVFW